MFLHDEITHRRVSVAVVEALSTLEVAGEQTRRAEAAEEVQTCRSI